MVRYVYSPQVRTVLSSFKLAAEDHGRPVIWLMSDSAAKGNAAPQSQRPVTEVLPGKQKSNSNYKGFVAGVFSGIAKLTGMYLLSQEAFMQSFVQSRLR